ncbi:L,D-transpeptidase family protein [Candidatus Omnitrophota bacterium]
MFNKSTIIIAIVAAIAIIIAVVSFAVLKSVPEVPEYSPGEANAEILYDKAGVLIRLSQYDEFKKALTVIIAEYPESSYAEKAMKNLGEIHMSFKEYDDAKYYYNRFLRSFPESSERDWVKGQLEKINQAIMTSPGLTSGSIEYVVVSGDSLYAIAKKYNTTVEFIKKMNGLTGDIIHVGQKLRINSSKFSIYVDKAKNILILKKDGEPFKTYNVATGTDNSTPVGTFTITDKLIEPPWTKPGVGVVLPGSDEYELGARWMAISIKGYGIHGTHDDTYIGKQTTSGCIRMYNNDVIEIYDMVPNGTEVEIVDGV